MMCGKHLVIPGKTSRDGLVCLGVLVMEHLDAKSQYFLQMSYDRREMKPVITYSTVGGKTYEALQKYYPETINKVHIDVNEGITIQQIRKVADDLGLRFKQSAIHFLIKNLYECFTQRDCTFIQLSPLVLTHDNTFRAANVTVHIDPNALYRQQQMALMADLSQKHMKERVASFADLNFHYLGGDIGVVSNSAGGCMATCDLLTAYGGQPANFSDLGGSVIHEQIESLLDLLETDKNISVIFVNCFGGIVNVDKIIATLRNHASQGLIKKPIVLRALGNKAFEGLKMVPTDYEYGIYVENDMDAAARLCVQVSKRVQEMRIKMPSKD